jgi:hypothetical protein
MSKFFGAASANQLSDEDKKVILEKAGVFARDPSAFPGLSLRLDPSQGLDTTFEPIGYDTRQTTGEMVHCSICSQKQEHFDGAIVRLQDQEIGLVGNKCGKRHFFGEDGWSSITNRIRQNEAQAIFAARFGPAKDSLIEVDRCLANWANRLRDVRALQDKFKLEMPKLFAAIGKEVPSGGLSVDQEQQVPFRCPNGQIEMRTEIYRVTLCRIDADWFFLNDNLVETVERVRPQLLEAFGFLDAESTPQNVNGVKRIMRTCRDSLLVVAEKQTKFKSLFTEKSLAKIAEWGNQSIKGADQYRSINKTLQRVRGDAIEGTVDFASAPLDLEFLWSEATKNWPRL